MSARDRLLGQARAQIQEVACGDAWQLRNEGAVLIDIREPDEVASGTPRASLRLVRGFLEMRIEQLVPDPETPVLLLCASGARSLLAALALRQMGYQDVRSVQGGFAQWQQDGLPIDLPRALDAQQRQRYARHLTIPEVGEAGQERLLQSRVLLVGAGGLGSPAAYYLAAAGVGTLTIVDDDVVDRTNLQRQILHTEDRIGMPKVESARFALNALNPDVEVVTVSERLRSDNVEELLAGQDVLLDGSDNFPTRYLLNDACVRLGIPNVHGSVYRFEGQVTVFWPARQESPGPCYRCLYPEPPPPELAPSCADAGVLGVLPGVVGLIEAIETIKLLLDVGEPLVGRLLHYDALKGRFQELRLERDPGCAYCGPNAHFPGYVDYEAFCTTTV